MRFRTILSLATLFIACFTLAVWAEPLPSQSISTNLNPTPDSASVAGQISSVGDASFTLDIKKSQDSQTLQFAIDGSTKVKPKRPPEVGEHSAEILREVMNYGEGEVARLRAEGVI